MAKQNPSNPGRRAPANDSPSGISGGTAGIVTMVALGAIIVIGLMNLTETRKQRTSLNERMSLLETQVAALGTKVDAVATKAAPPRQQGPDPNRVYPVKTEGAPVRGPKAAPVTIALFSDFQ
jgi:protein-disulfide isomerase